MNHKAEHIGRRKMLVAPITGVGLGGLAMTSRSIAQPRSEAPFPDMTKELWLDTLLEKKSLAGPLHLFRFVERMYVLTKPIAWSPNPGQSYKRVAVPHGFVTDFASIPRLFWSFLPPDGEYAYAAVLHDYLYWQQDRSREESDEILKFAMEDLKVGEATVAAIYLGVRAGGGGSWDSNREIKVKGEKRMVRPEKLPTSGPPARWSDFRKLDGVFVE